MQRYGYSTGGIHLLSTVLLSIQLISFPSASDGNATDVGDISATWDTRRTMGQSSTTNGYASGGVNPVGTSNIIEKFPFATDTNATDVGDLTLARYLW